MSSFSENRRESCLESAESFVYDFTSVASKPFFSISYASFTTLLNVWLNMDTAGKFNGFISIIPILCAKSQPVILFMRTFLWSSSNCGASMSIAFFPIHSDISVSASMNDALDEAELKNSHFFMNHDTVRASSLSNATGYHTYLDTADRQKFLKKLKNLDCSHDICQRLVFDMSATFPSSRAIRELCVALSSEGSSDIFFSYAEGICESDIA